jgi:hypothetical protein
MKGNTRPGNWLKRRNKSEIIEDSFADLTVEEQDRLMPVLQGLYRQKKRGGAALADIPKKDPPTTVSEPMFKDVKITYAGDPEVKKA